MLAREYLHKIMQECQQAINQLDQNDKRRTVGLIDEIEHHAEAAKWILINEVIEKEGKF